MRVDGMIPKEVYYVDLPNCIANTSWMKISEKIFCLGPILKYMFQQQGEGCIGKEVLTVMFRYVFLL